MPPTDDKLNPTGHGFQERTNMVEKLQELEDEKNELFQICPAKHRDTYKYGTESHLVRVVSENMHQSYNDVIRSVETLHRIRSAGGLDVQNLDIHEHSFSDDHLPPWSELKDALVQQYDVNCRNWGVSGLPKQDTTNKKIPSMIMNEGGAAKCFACGDTGHRRGADSCKAGPRDVHSSAPDWVKNRAKGGGNGFKVGSGKGICNFYKNNGTCRFGEKCKYAHEKGASSTGGVGGFKKGERKRVASMVAQSLVDRMEKSGKKTKSDTTENKGKEDPIDRLYALMTGTSS